MDIFQILKKDHQKAKELMEKLENTGPRAVTTREKLFMQLKNDLEAHTHGEDVVVYPALRQLDEMEEIIDEAKEEHAEVASLLEEMEDVQEDQEAWASKLTELKKAVLHHVKEEEGEMFKKAKNLLSKEDSQALGKEFQEAKKQAAAE